jgi:hypothetical protein
MKPLLLPLFLLFIVISCQELDEPNIDLRILTSIGDCMPTVPPVTIPDSTATPYTGYLDLNDVTSVIGVYNPTSTTLRIHKGILRMTLDPGYYILRMQVEGSTEHSFQVTDAAPVEGDVYLRKCTSY